MSFLRRRWLCWLALIVAWFAPYAQAADEPRDFEPLRLSHVGGSVSFMRYGAEDWTVARVNTPLAAGDALYVGERSELELQLGSRAFIRADDETQLTLVSQERDFLQLRIPSGRVSLDLRALPAGLVIELDTPNAAFTIDRPGYYRVDVDGDVHFITRRGGRAVVVPAGGAPYSIRPSEEVVVEGSDPAQVSSYVAPEPDRWDRWNEARSREMLDAVSERYLPPGVAGARELDHYGSWRVVRPYGPVWVPDGLPPGWVPYSTGRWIWDPYYGWTWVDDAPWGWVPFHYGRWLFLDGYWAWAPGPVVVARPVYAPALVAFFRTGEGVSLGLGIGPAGLAWVALSWGEPLLPWWGPPRFVGRPWWGGWGGPRIVNQVVVHPTTVINVTHIRYENLKVAKTIVVTDVDRFGYGSPRVVRIREREQERELRHVRGELAVRPDPRRLAGDDARGLLPPREVLERPVVAVRPARPPQLPWRVEAPHPLRLAEPRHVAPPRRPAGEFPRPPEGREAGPERPRPGLPPAYGDMRESRGRGEGDDARRPERDGYRPRVVPAEPGSERPREVPRVREEPPRPRPAEEGAGRWERRERSDPGLRPQRMEREERIERRERVERSLPGEAANRPWGGRGGDEEGRRSRRPEPRER